MSSAKVAPAPNMSSVHAEHAIISKAGLSQKIGEEEDETRRHMFREGQRATAQVNMERKISIWWTLDNVSRSDSHFSDLVGVAAPLLSCTTRSHEACACCVMLSCMYADASCSDVRVCLACIFLTSAQGDF